MSIYNDQIEPHPLALTVNRTAERFHRDTLRGLLAASLEPDVTSSMLESVAPLGIHARNTLRVVRALSDTWQHDRNVWDEVRLKASLRQAR